MDTLDEVKTCVQEIEHSLGTMVVVEKLLRYDEAVEHCKSLSGILAPFFEKKWILEMTELLQNCVYARAEVDENEPDVINSRFYTPYLVGLKIEFDKATWTNGLPFNPDKYNELFRYTMTPKGGRKCGEAMLIPNEYKLTALTGCAAPRKSLCWVYPKILNVPALGHVSWVVVAISVTLVTLFILMWLFFCAAAFKTVQKVRKDASMLESSRGSEL